MNSAEAETIISKVTWNNVGRMAEFLCTVGIHVAVVQLGHVACLAGTYLFNIEIKLNITLSVDTMVSARLKLTRK